MPSQPLSYHTPKPFTTQYTSIAGIFHATRIRTGITYFSVSAEGGSAWTFNSPTTYENFMDSRIAAGERIVRRWWVGCWTLRLIAAMQVPEPPLPAGAVESKRGVCDEYSKIVHPLHSAMPAEAVVYRPRGEGNFYCAECIEARNKALAAYERLNAPAKTLEYTQYADAA